MQGGIWSGKAVQEGYESLQAGGGGETHIQPAAATLPEKRNRPILQIAASSYRAGGRQASTSDGATGSLASATCHIIHSSFRRRGRWKRRERRRGGNLWTLAAALPPAAKLFACGTRLKDIVSSESILKQVHCQTCFGCQVVWTQIKTPEFHTSYLDAKICCQLGVSFKSKAAAICDIFLLLCWWTSVTICLPKPREWG